MRGDVAAGVKNRSPRDYQLSGLFIVIPRPASQASRIESQGQEDRPVDSQPLFPDREYPVVTGHLAASLKPHQWEGVRFMWTNIVDE